MAVDGLGAARQAEQLQQERRSAETQKTGAFQALMKKGDAKAGGKDKADKGDRSEKSEKSEKSDKREPQGMIDSLLGHHDRLASALHSKMGEGGGEGGGGGDGKGEGEGDGKAAALLGKGKAGEAEGDGKVAGKGGGAFGEKLRGKLDGKGAAEKSAKAEAGAKSGKQGIAGKAAKGGLAEKAEGKAGAEGAADAKGAQAKGEAAKADQAKAAAQEARKSDAKQGERDSSTKPDDGKTMQEQIAKNMFPGEVPHPFLMQQVDAPQDVKATQVVIPPEIVDKIVAQARFGTNAAGASEFQIQLKDDVFKGAELKIATKDGKVSVELVAKDADSAATFEQKAQEIAKQLSDKGLKVENVSVSVAQQGGGQDASQGQSRGRDQQQQNRGVGGVGGAKSGGQRAVADSGAGVDSGRKSGKDYSA